MSSPSSRSSWLSTRAVTTAPAVALAMAGLGLSALVAIPAASATTTHGPTSNGESWFHDPLSPKTRANQLPVPADPGSYSGAIRHTTATFRALDGALAVPMSWAKGHDLEESQALTLDQENLFQFKSATLTADAKAKLGALDESMSRVVKVRCQGFADYGGRIGYTKQLSADRAAAVCAELQGNRPSLLTAAYGYGGQYPVIVGGRTSHRMENRSDNRRVVIVVAKSIPGTTAPAAPVLDAVQAEDGGGQLYFTAPDDGGDPIFGYEYTVDGGDTWIPLKEKEIDPGKYTARVFGLTNGTTYSASVRAVNKVGDSQASNSQSFTPTAPVEALGAPTITSASNPQYSYPTAAVTLSFSAPSEDGGSAITGYQYSKDSGTNWSAISYSGAVPTHTTEITEAWSCDNFVRNYQIRAVNGSGPGPASNTQAVTYTDLWC